MTELAPILSLIPQRPPFVMVSRLVDFSPTGATTVFDVPQQGQLLSATHLTETGIMEHMAQSCAAYIGYRNRTQPVKIGVIGAISNFELITHPRLGQSISTSITVMAEVGDMLMVEVRTALPNGHQCASCQMKISLID